MAKAREGLGARLGATLARGVIAALRVLPYETRLAVAGWIAQRIVSPLAGYPARIRANLAMVRPDLSAGDIARITRDVPGNFGRTIAELFSPDDFAARVKNLPIEGEGLAALQQAHAAGRPSVLVSGHFGNYDAVRAALIAQGFRVGGLYRPLNNRTLNAAYVATISAIGTPLFARGRRGMGEMIRFLNGGGTLAMLIDQHMGHGAALTFFGRTAWTATSIAEIALRYDAVVIACYGIRQPDGVSFRIVMEPPTPRGTAAAMTQALNDSLERQVRAHMGQWNWMHRRWKVLPHRSAQPD